MSSCEPPLATVDVTAFGSLGRRAAGGAIWVFLSFGASKMLVSLANLPLARLLTPQDFGLVSFAMVAINAQTILADVGVPQSIIYGKRDIKAVGGTALTINVVAALVLFGLTALLSPWLAAFGRDKGIGPVVTLLAVGLILSSLGSVQNAHLQKELAFRRKFLPDVLPGLAFAVISVLLALLGFGVWSLVIGYLVRTASATIVFWLLTDMRPWPGLRWSIARELLGYGRHVTFALIINFGVANVDYVIIGYALGTSDLGAYTLAFLIGTLMTSALFAVVSTVVFPALSLIRDDAEAARRMLADVVSLVCFVTISATILLFALAPAYVPLLLGSRWVAVVVPLQVLTVYSALRNIEGLANPVFRAAGRPDLAWKLTLLRLVTVAPLIWLAVRGDYGIVGVAAVQVFAAAVFVPLSIGPAGRVIGMSVGSLWRLFQPHVLGASVAGLVLAAASGFPLMHATMSGAVGSAALALVALAAYVLLVIALNPRIASLGRSAVRLSNL